MFQWYRSAGACFVYLQDVACRAEEVMSGVQLASPGPDHSVSIRRAVKEAHVQPIGVHTTNMLKASKWFTRGWTLQELIAPSSVLFVDKDWHIFGSKDTMGELVSDIIGITNVNHVYWFELERYSVATRMSWASERRCTRLKDLAYSLMGLFNVHMPLLYGEGGENAFRRLQLEILKNNRDESIFTWAQRARHRPDVRAPSPSCFANLSNVRCFKPIVSRLPYPMTNNGLEIHTVLLQGCDPKSGHERDRVYFLPLNCFRDGETCPWCYACCV